MSFSVKKENINIKGRPKGSPNKDKAKIKATFELLIENNIDRLQEDFDSLQPSQRIKFLLEVASFVVPKLKATDLHIEEQREFQPIIIQMEAYEQSDN